MFVRFHPEAFFTPDEAVALLDNNSRSIYSLAHAWQTADHPDPHGWTLSGVRNFLRGPFESAAAFAASSPPAQKWQSYLNDIDECGLFWEYVHRVLNPTTMAPRPELTLAQSDCSCVSQFHIDTAADALR